MFSAIKPSCLVVLIGIIATQAAPWQSRDNQDCGALASQLSGNLTQLGSNVGIFQQLTANSGDASLMNLGSQVNQDFSSASQLFSSAQDQSILLSAMEEIVTDLDNLFTLLQSSPQLSGSVEASANVMKQQVQATTNVAQTLENDCISP